MTTSTATLAQVLDQGDLNTVGNAMKEGKVGSILSGPRSVYEVVSASSTTVTLSFTAVSLNRVKTIGLGAAGEKTALSKFGATPSAGEAACNSAGTAVILNAESTGSGTVLVVYETNDPPTGATALTSAVDGLY